MKIFMAILGLFVATQAQALTWEEVQSNPARYYIDSPRIAFDAGVFTRLVTLSGEANVCVAGDQIYGGPFTKCVAHSNNANDYNKRNCPADKLRTVQLFKDISGTYTLCKDPDSENDDPRTCDDAVEVPYSIDTNVRVNIFRKSRINLSDSGNATFERLGPSHPAYVGHVRVQLPACAD
jgi:hypothetical protein